jgi:hypothetical protein
MPGIEIKGRSKRANYRHGGRVGLAAGTKEKSSLKPVPSENKGLAKLPTAVRNNMGFLNKGGRVKKSMGGGLYENIHKKRARIKAGSGEKMRSPGSAGAPTAKNFTESAKTAKKT